MDLPTLGVSGILRIYDSLIKFVRLSAVQTSLEQCTSHLRNSFCDFQLRYTNYQFIASRKHKNFKELFIRDPKNSTSGYEDLNTFLENGMKTLCGDITESIQDYFSLTHNHEDHPYIRIYIFDEEKNLWAIAMLPSKDEDCSPERIENYKSFSDVYENGVAHLENNLPKAIKNNNYRHNGISVYEIKEKYKLRIQDWKLFARWRNNIIRHSKLDEKWNDISNSKFPYNSRLVVPITYRAHTDKERLDKKMVKMLKLKENRRSILGLLCIDHTATYYFDSGKVRGRQNIDINVMYIYADMLSLVFVTMLMYTIGSSTCDNYLRFFGEGKS